MAPADDLPPLEQVTRRTAHDQIYLELRDGLMSGRFRPGQQLKLRPLAKAFGTSPLPVRDALGRLVAEKALTVSPSRTTEVPTLTREGFEDLSRVRRLIEGDAAAAAVERITAAERRELDRLNALMKKQFEDGDQTSYLAGNRAFHFTVYRASRSSVACEIIEGLWLRAGPALTLLSGFGQKITSTMALVHHADLMRAFETGDAEAARAAIQADIHDASTCILSRILDKA